MKKTLLWLIAIVCLAINSLIAQTDTLNSEITLKTYLESTEVPLNKGIVYHVELSWPGDLDRFQISDIGDPVITNLTLRGSGSSNKLGTDSQGNPLSIRRVTYYLNPIEIGMAYIDGLTIQYTDNLLNKSETLFAQRISVKITEAVSEPLDKITPGVFLFWGLPIIFLALVIYFVIRYLQRRKLVDDNLAPVKTTEEKYLDILKETVRIPDAPARENISSLKKTLNGYVGEKYSIPGTIDLKIVKDRLEKLNIEKEFITKIELMYEKADLAQFAAEPIEATDLHLFFDSIEHILMKINNDVKNNSGDQ